ncbi:MAG TPA: hypothetical protein VEU55_00845 [Gemmatimonadales bacterium]|nr:hypothetical protein [Gemmatimonadales bacterium]
MAAPRTLALAAAAALTSIAGCGGARGPKITLRYRPPTGTAYHYALEQANSWMVRGGGRGALQGSDLTLHLYFTQAVTGPVAGGLGATVIYDSATMVPTGYAPALDRMRGLASAVVYDDRGQVVSAHFTALSGAPSPIADKLAQSVLETALPLPERAVGVGDSWTAEDAPLGATLGVSVKARLRCTVQEIRRGAADTTVRITVERTFLGDPVTVTELSPAGVPERRVVRVAGKFTGERLLSVATSLPVRATLGGLMTIDVSAPGGVEETTISRQFTLQLLGAK